MAYKFQLGEAKLSGSITQTDGSGDLRATTVDSLDVSSGGISNAGAIAGASTIAGSGLASLGSLAVDDGSTIGTDSDTDMITLTNGSDIALANDLDFNIAKAGGLQLAGVSVSSTAAELNLLDGAAADTIVNSKAVIYGSAGEVNSSAFHISGQEVIDGSGNAALGNVEVDGFVSASSHISASALDIENGAQIGGDVLSNGKVYGVTMAAGNSEEFAVSSAGAVSAASLNVDDGGTIGTDSDTDMLTLTNADNITVASDVELILSEGKLKLGSTAVTSTAAELNLLDGAAADTVVNSKAVIYGSAGEVNATSFDISGTEVISSAGNLAVNAIEFDGNIDIANAGGFSLGASMGANTMTLGGSTSTVRVAGDLEVVGTLNRVTETELLIEDKAVIVASGSANAAAAAGAGLVVDIASGDMSWLYQANGENVGGVNASSSGDIFVASGSAGLIDIQAAAFYGDGSNLTNVNASGVEETVQDVNSTGTINLNNGLQVLADCSAGDITLTLPLVASLEGKMLKIKRKGGGNAVTLDTTAGTIDGASTIVLDSDFAAVTIISDGSNFFVI